MAARPNIELRLIPDRSGWHPGLEGEFSLIESSGSSSPRANDGSGPIVFVGTRRTVLMLHGKEDVEAYKRAIDRIFHVSYSLADSVDFIANLRKRMEKFVVC
jgi:flagellar motor component MotA